MGLSAPNPRWSLGAYHSSIPLSDEYYCSGIKFYGQLSIRNRTIKRYWIL
jgi:hypothetical protein